MTQSCITATITQEKKTGNLYLRIQTKENEVTVNKIFIIYFAFKENICIFNYGSRVDHTGEIDQLRYIKIQPKTILNRPQYKAQGNNCRVCGFIHKNHVPRSVVLVCSFRLKFNN